MKKLALLSVLLVNVLFAQKTITVDKIPTSTDEFIKFRDGIASTPEGGAIAFIVGSIIYSKNPQMGRECLVIQTDMSQLTSSNKGYKGYDLSSSNDYVVRQLEQKPYISASYVQGTSNANGYEFKEPLKFKIERVEKLSDGQVKVFVWSTGADTPRPIRLKQNDKGMWKAMEYSSIFVGVRPPVVKSKGAVDGDF